MNINSFDLVDFVDHVDLFDLVDLFDIVDLSGGIIKIMWRKTDEYNNCNK